jgi:hypothetical protein
MVKNAMLKKKYIWYTVLACFVISLYLVYVGEDRVTLMINQGTYAPGGLNHVSINHRRGLACLLFNVDGAGSASCETSRAQLTQWMMETNIEVVHWAKDSSGQERVFCTVYDSLPLKIRNSEIPYVIQIDTYSSNSRLVKVIPLDEYRVQLHFYSNWN